MENRRKWSVDRTINLPTLLSVLGACVFIIGFFVVQDRRMTTLEIQKTVQDKDIVEMRVALHENGIKLDIINGNQMVVMSTLERMERKR